MRSLGFKRLAWLTGVVATTALVFGAVVASAATIGGFGARPASIDPHNPATRAYFIIDSKAGGTRREAVIVTNDGATPVELAVSAVDGLTGVTSGVVYANAGVAVKQAGAWVTPAVSQVRVPPRSSLRVHFAVKIPSSAQPGDHLAGLALQALQPSESGRRFSVKVVMRTVIGIELQVRGAATPRIQMFSVALAPLPGTQVPSAVVTLEDVGRRLCQPRLTVVVKGQGAPRSATQTLGTILPGDKIAYPFKWPDSLSHGRYAVTAIAASCGPRTVLHTVATYGAAGVSSGSGTNGLGPTAPLASSPDSSPSWLPYGLVGLAALLGTGTATWFIRRHYASASA
jgi:hypothetical protein